jgi:hypothetical protein
MPGDLGQVGDWLGRAETLIASDDIPTIMNEETASIISRKLEEHKVKHTLQLMIKYLIPITGVIAPVNHSKRNSIQFLIMCILILNYCVICM